MIALSSPTFRRSAIVILVAAVLLLFVPLIGSIGTLIGMVVLWALSSALIRPSMSALISRTAPADLRGTLFGVNDSLSNIAFIIGALIVAVGVLGYNLYQTKKEPDGLQINIGPKGLKVQNK